MTLTPKYEEPLLELSLQNLNDKQTTNKSTSFSKKIYLMIPEVVEEIQGKFNLRTNIMSKMIILEFQMNQFDTRMQRNL